MPELCALSFLRQTISTGSMTTITIKTTQPTTMPATADLLLARDCLVDADTSAWYVPVTLADTVAELVSVTCVVARTHTPAAETTYPSQHSMHWVSETQRAQNCNDVTHALQNGYVPTCPDRQAHARSVVAVGAPDSYPRSDRHVVRLLHTLFVVGVGARDSYDVAMEQVVSGTQLYSPREGA